MQADSIGGFLASHYPLIRTTHVSMVVLTATLMALRLGMAFRGIDYRHHAVLRVAPHAIDSVLLASAAMLAIATGQYPFAQAWLSAKLVALCLYIACGALALDMKRPATTRKVASLVALLLLAYIIAVATTRNPLICI